MHGTVGGHAEAIAHGLLTLVRPVLVFGAHALSVGYEGEGAENPCSNPPGPNFIKLCTQLSLPL